MSTASSTRWGPTAGTAAATAAITNLFTNRPVLIRRTVTGSHDDAMGGGATDEDCMFEYRQLPGGI